MAKPYSTDLRERVAAAIASGDSCRAIAEQYEIAPSTVAKWSKRVRETGSVAPAKFGGYRTCSSRAASRLRPGAARRGAAPDVAQAQGHAGRSRHRRVARYGLALPAARRPVLQKKPRSPVSSIAPTSPPVAGAGSGRSVISIRSASSSSTRPGSRPTWHRSAAGVSGARGSKASLPTAAGARSPSLRRSEPMRLTAPCVVDGPINGVDLPRLRRAVPRPGTAPWRHRRPRQSRQPSCAGDTRCDPRRRRQARVPAALLAGLQSDRAGLRQGQALAANGTSALHRRHPRSRGNARRRHQPRMHQLLQNRWIRFQLNLKGSRARSLRMEATRLPCVRA